MAGDVFFEDGDVAAGGFQVEVSEQCGADVYRQAVVDEVGDEQPSKVVWPEMDSREPRIGCSEFFTHSS